MKTFFTLLLFVLAGFTESTAQTTTVPQGWKKQIDTAYNFTFYYPVDWNLKLPRTNTRFFITSKAEGDADPFLENLNCIARTLQDKNFKVTDGEDEIKQTLSKNLKDFKLLYSGYSSWNGSQMLTIEYTCSKEGDGINYNLHLLQKIVITKGILFTFTYTAEAKNYDKYADTINKIVRLIRFN